MFASIVGELEAVASDGPAIDGFEDDSFEVLIINQGIHSKKMAEVTLQWRIRSDNVVGSSCRDRCSQLNRPIHWPYCAAEREH